jgi:cytoskeletal protein CcmA (bactofilin family)
VNGNVTVQERCELKSNAELLGDLKAMRIIIEEGATFIGHSEVTPTKTASFTRSSASSQVNENAA